MIRDSATGWVEATITINGHVLTFAESMAIRVAVSSFRMFVCDPDAANALGPVAVGYDRALATVEDKLRKPA